MPNSSPRQPRLEAQMGFAFLMDLYDRGRQLDANGKKNAITKFLAISDPDVEKQIKWGALFKSDNQANWIVEAVRGGLDQFRAGKPFTRLRPQSEFFEFDGDIGKFQDGLIWDRGHSRTARLGTNNPCQLFITRVFELLTEIAPWLRVCQRDECGRLFLYQRSKQMFCTDQCAQRVRMARFLKQRKSK